MKFDWEWVEGDDDSSTLRARVIGGWLVVYESKHIRPIPDSYSEFVVIYPSMVFVPDPNHQWNIDE